MSDTTPMAGRGHDASEVAAQFRAFADAEGSRIPTYAAISRIVAEHRELHELLLLAPTAQRLPVLLLAALHDLVLRRPGVPVAPWYPSVTEDPLPGTHPGLEAALLATVHEHHDELAEVLRTRQVQTNEVNRCTAWWLGLQHLCHDAAPEGPDRALALVELGASAGLNLLLDRYSYRFEAPGATTVLSGQPDSSVRLGTRLRTGGWPGLERPLPPVLARLGIDHRPVDPTDAQAGRWLRACTWPEQPVRGERLDAALRTVATDPPEIVVGDLVADLPGTLEQVLERAGRRSEGPVHVVALASWALVYVRREDRDRLHDTMRRLGAQLATSGSRLSLLTLEPANTLPWLEPPPLPANAGADERQSSLLAATTFADQGRGGVVQPRATPLARCQAHLVWTDRL